MCNCRSYNNGADGADEVVLAPPDTSLTNGKKSVCVDRCISKVIEAIWCAGLATLGSCCGHNKDSPSIVIPEHTDPKLYFDVIAAVDKRDWNVLRWELVSHKMKRNQSKIIQIGGD